MYLANLDPYIGSEQGGTRPVVVLQNNTGNYYCPTLIIAPITSKAGKKPSQPTHYYACLLYTSPLAEYITEEMGLGQDGGAG